MKSSLSNRVLIAALLLAASSPVFAQSANKQIANVVGQGPAGPIVSADGATLIRTKNGISLALNMPTPVPGSYNYPPPNPFQTVAPVPGTPEVFTGWAFIFNTPASCTTPNQCLPTPDDYALGHGAAYNYAGHAVSGGGNLNLVGYISVGESPFFALPPGVAEFFPLVNPSGAEVHIAVAPHGVLVPDLLPDQLNTPVGNPAFWWIAVFPPSP